VIEAYIAIGSNVGDREEFCRRAVAALDARAGIDVVATSSLYETSPIGPPQRSFINMVIKVATELSARKLFEACKETEAALGREPSDVKWGPRIVDLDVLLYGNDKIVEADLEIPHPRMTQRRFVLIPLLEIDAGLTDPWGNSFSQYVEDAEGEVSRLAPFEADGS
jgi:2-amino-4-hydroxy-6-hydroxymethyldihydropteridine diphosphokinase